MATLPEYTDEIVDMRVTVALSTVGDNMQLFRFSQSSGSFTGDNEVNDDLALDRMRYVTDTPDNIIINRTGTGSFLLEVDGQSGDLNGLYLHIAHEEGDSSALASVAWTSRTVIGGGFIRFDLNNDFLEDVADGDHLQIKAASNTESGADLTPTFGTDTIADQSYTESTAIATLQLPAATSGDAPLTYSISPAVPAGLAFSASTRQITGTPTATQAATTYTYTVTDDDGDTADLTFTITVTAAAVVIVVDPAPPGLIVEWADNIWTDEPAASDWNSVAADSYLARWNRGRQTERDEHEVGTMSLSLRNVHGDYWPTATNAPGAGHQIRLRAAFAGTTYDLFRGVIESWDPTIRGDRVPRILATGVDNRRQLNRADVSTGSGGFPSERTDLRVGRVLNAASWPAAWRRIDQGQETMTAAAADTTAKASEFMRQADEVEFGQLYVAADGDLVFRARNALADAPAITLGPDDVPAFDPDFEYTDRHVANRVTVTRTGGTPQVANDTASQARFGIVPLDLSDLALTTNAAASGLAQARLSARATPGMELRRLTLRPSIDPAVLYPAILGTDIGASVAVHWDDADGLMQNYRLEGVEIEVTTTPHGGPTWSATWRLGIAADPETFWLLGVAGSSELGDTTRLYI